MTCKEVLKKLKKELETKEVEFVEKQWERNFVMGECIAHLSSLLCARIILRIPYSGFNSKKYIVEKVVTLLHEMGHMHEDQQMTLVERSKLLTAFKTRSLRGYRSKIVIQAEKDAWDSAWKIAVKFGLNKNGNFKKRFQEEKTSGLTSYKVPLKGYCV